MTPRLLYPMDIVIVLFAVAMLVLVLWLAISGKLSGGGGSPLASLTAFHDFLPRDKQEAIEMVIEQAAGKRLEEQTSGDGTKEGAAERAPEGAREDPTRGTAAGTGNGAGHVSGKETGRVPGRGADQGPGEGALQGSSREMNRGTGRSSTQGAEERTNEGAPRGTREQESDNERT